MSTKKKYAMIVLINGETVGVDLEDKHDIEIGKRLRARNVISYVREPTKEEYQELLEFDEMKMREQ